MQVMKSLTMFLHMLLEDLGQWCRTSTVRDCKTVTNRIEHEGLSFLTITLPSFGRDLEKALAQGEVTADLFVGFQRKGKLPKFLGGFLSDVFDPEGILFNNPSVLSIWALRQFTLMFAKMSDTCSDARIQAAFDKYVEIEQEVREYDRRFNSSICWDGTGLMDRYHRVCTLVLSEALQSSDEDVYY
jgi:hypothetical protein